MRLNFVPSYYSSARKEDVSIYILYEGGTRFRPARIIFVRYMLQRPVSTNSRTIETTNGDRTHTHTHTQTHTQTDRHLQINIYEWLTPLFIRWRNAFQACPYHICTVHVTAAGRY